MKNIYTDYASFNLWANQRLSDVFLSMPEELASKTIISSFPSAKLTLLHIWDAEFLWLKRLNGVSPPNFPSKNFEGTTKNAIENLLQCSADFLEFVESQPEEFFGKTLEFSTISYGPSGGKAYEMIHHCMNHSTYHRGQLVTMARQLAVEKLPVIDFIYFLRNR